MTTFVCAGCDVEHDADELPTGWSRQNHPTFGVIERCIPCTAKIAPKAVTQRSTPGEGHNSGDAASFQSDDVITGAAQGRLRSFIERIERLEEDKAEVSTDLKELYLEAKGEGFDVKILRKVVRIRKMDKTALSEEEALIDLYMSAIEG